jgi:hypothetical protein
MRSHWHDSGDAYTCDLKTSTMSAEGLWMLALDRTEHKGRPHNRAFLDKRLLKSACSRPGRHNIPPRTYFWLSQPEVRLRTPNIDQLDDDWIRNLTPSWMRSIQRESCEARLNGNLIKLSATYHSSISNQHQ